MTTRRRKVSEAFMRRVLLPGALWLLFGSSLPAATVTGCLLDSGSTACYTTGMFSFADSLDWGAAVNLAGTGQSGFGPAYSMAAGGNPDNPHNVSISPWNARSVGNVNIYASLGAGTGTPLLTRVDNTYWGYGPMQTSNGTVLLYQPMDNITAPKHLDTFAGHFNANP